MFRARLICLLLALCCLLSLGTAALAAEVDCDTTYCFTSTDFAETEALTGICVTGLPASNTGTVLLGSRVICAGDILTADQLQNMTFSPLRTETDRDAVLTYLPIYENRVEKPATMTLAIRGKEDLTPMAQDSALETYKNLPNEGMLQAQDPEGEALTFALVRKPKRGSVELREDGTFTYTPKRNKVGVDSFTYTAADPAGNVSREATVTVQILKPTDARQYADTVGTDCRFTAEWMRHTGLFVGEQIGMQACFFPEKEVSRGDFLAMLVQALDIPVDNAQFEGIPADVPQWLRPYLTAALRSGLLSGIPDRETFGAHEPITGAEAAVMLQNGLDLDISRQTLETMQQEGAQEDVPAWAAVSLTAMEDNGICLEANTVVDRGQLANILYQASRMAPNAPGSSVFRKQN
ncbi:MAG: cadherin-like domain-containing protein [Oscillospiraceae bacterium]|nr:cadherin-like domain-containing protein [Oscillospiraceae bacterium]